ncbi:MAG TPA: hypothetical protein PKC24_09215 [Cyclobacteriaceae bacterium]|nr:hypothetical protein [Cyclobacteriaceae bacterium]
MRVLLVHQIVLMFLQEVNTPGLAQDFIKVNVICNAGNSDWIQPLDKDIHEVFDQSKNKAFRHGEVVRWLLRDEESKLIGRIAAFVNKKYTNKGDEFPVGGIGFFECINNQQAANLLFDTAKAWLQERKVEAMDGPINFGERDKWWGLLVKGFHAPLYGMNYNPPYYQALFENYGFQTFYNQICWELPVAGESTQLQKKFYEAHARYAGNPDFKAVHVRKNQSEKFAHDFCTVYNKAWAKHAGNKEMSNEQALKIFKAMKPVMDENLGWFVYYKEAPIAMWINLPDLNQIFKFMQGKFGLLQKLKFLYYQKRGVCDRIVGLVYGIVPEFQSTGVDYFMIVEAEKVIKKKTRYKSVELLWQGDFNPKILNISRSLGAEQSRTLVTYRYIFDRSKPFKRHPMIE